MPTVTTAKSTIEVRLLPERTARRALPRSLNALGREYGVPETPEPMENPLRELIAAALDEGSSSQKDADRAFKEIESRFIDWNEVRVSRPAEVEAAIAPIPGAAERARHIVRSLNSLFSRHGTLSLAFLAEERPREAEAFLRKLEGADDEMVARVLLFGFGFPAVPLNAHVVRVAARLGLINEETEADTIRRRLEKICTRDRMHEVFTLMTEHGRKQCLVTKPKCRKCPVLTNCPTGKALTPKKRTTRKEARTAGKTRGKRKGS